MTKLELRLQLLAKGRTVTWLAAQLGYSNTYLYKVLEIQKKDDIQKIKKILEGI